ncbi:MAG: class I SAM-dependent methyltransferase [Chloroflexi bacterium]|nr:class I SAM-dependent methyltransferase [Chloroflexota bacterium]
MTSGKNSKDRDSHIPYFDRRASCYQRDSLNWPWSMLRASEAAGIDRMMGDVSGLNLLDLGCGAGYYANLYIDRAPSRLAAVDSSSLMIDQITDKRIECLVADAATAKLNGHFDRIISAGLLEFVDDEHAVLINARRHIHRDGKLIVLIPRKNPAGNIYQLFHKRNGINIRLFELSQFQRLAASCGWSLIDQSNIFPFSIVAAFKTSADSIQ